MTMHGNPYDDATDPRVATIQQWQEDGWTAAFQVGSDGRIGCPTCAGDHRAQEYGVDHLGRHEGISNPDDEELLVALTCSECGQQGTLTLGYGPQASADDAEVARRLPARSG